MNTRKLAASLAALALASAAAAQPLSTAFTYQGRLTSSGQPATGAYDFKFALFDAPAAGAQDGPQLCADNVAVAAGQFTVQLDFGAQFDGQQRYLELWVRPHNSLGCGNSSGFTILGPRQSLTAAPNAAFSLTAANASNASTAANATQLNSQPASFYLNAANMSAGTIPDARLSLNVAVLDAAQTISGVKTFSAPPAFAAAGAPFSVSSTARIPNLNADLLDGMDATAFLGSSAPVFISGAPYGPAVLNVVNTETFYSTTAIQATLTATAGTAIVGYASAPTGGVTAISGTVDSSSGTAIFGDATSTTGSTIGVRGLTRAPTGVGVLGTGFSTGANVGVWGDTISTTGIGVRATGGATSGVSYGLYAETSSTSGRAIGAFANATTGITYAGRFETPSTSGRALYAVATAASGTTYGIFAQASTAASGYAVYSAGDLGASGTKSFRIDHPQDPQNKYLLHYCSEAPEPQNFYNGKVTLNDQGEATVQLPPYFAAINKDPRYTLTPIGAPMPMLHVAREIEESALATGAAAQPGDQVPPCSFSIAGGSPGAKVSWEVKALRNDRWVRLRGSPAEMDKPSEERGTYLHPDLFGQPASLQLGYEPPRTR